MDHWDTDNPHTHVDDQVPSGLIDTDRAYLTRGMRLRACELASEWLGPRTELEIRRTVEREVGQERWTSLDRALLARAREGLVDLREVPAEADVCGRETSSSLACSVSSPWSSPQARAWTLGDARRCRGGPAPAG